MEQRLADLKANMSQQKEKRDAARQRNPTGSMWKSARSDAPTNSAYVSQVLDKNRQPTPPDGGARRRTPTDAARETRPLLEPTSMGGAVENSKLTSLLAAQHPTSFAQANAARRQQQQQQPTQEGSLGGTKPSFDWNPSASFAFGGGDDGAFEDLLGPELSAAPAPPPLAPAAAASPRGGGSLLDGTFDEEANAASFKEAVRAFRGEPAASEPTQPAGGSLLDGTFDEEANAASFQEALRAFRGEPAPMKPTKPAGASTTAAPSRAPRFVVQPAAAPAEPTLADKVHCLKEELGLPVAMVMGEAVRAANAAVGLDNLGSLTDQVGRLLRETGVRPTRGAAPTAALSPGRASAGTATVDLSAGDAAGGAGSPGSRPTSSHGVMTTQTAPATSFYERFLEQKRRDMVA
jgi:hypothetical protein